MKFIVRIAVVNGPNLNLLGQREPDVYGHTTLADIENHLSKVAEAAGCELQFTQSNAEHELIDYIQRAQQQNVDGIIINPAAFTHTSVALRDALLATEIPFVEVHLSNVHAREAFRHDSWFSDIAIGTITGLGAFGYEAALRYFIQSPQT